MHEKFLSQKVIVIIRVKQATSVMPMIEALVAGGVECLEVTSNTPGYLDSIAAARRRWPDLLVGAGTVTDVDIASAAIEHGAQFLVTPNTHPPVIDVAHAAGVPVAMGALTPTEVCIATAAGADVIKLFPAGQFGPGYIKAVKGPLNDVKLFAVGGVSADNVQQWADAGADGFGVGGKLVEEHQIINGHPEAITQAAQTLLAAVTALE